MTNYRYRLYRDWLGSGGRCNFIMLNPSTADDVFDDPTIRKCIGFAKRWGFSGLVVTNLFAFRATDPADLRALARLDYAAAVGSDNDGHLIREANCRVVVAAWGDHGKLYGRDEDVLNRVLEGRTVGCIGTTKGGNPLHPCRAPYTAAPEIFPHKVPDSLVTRVP